MFHSGGCIVSLKEKPVSLNLPAGFLKKKAILHGSLWIIVILSLLVMPCFGSESNESVAAGKVTVTDVDIEPSVLMTGDVGIITFTVENTGDSNVVISDAQLVSKEITVLNSEIYKSSRTIGAGTDMKFTFTILANQPENIYYPALYLNYKDAGSLRYNVPVRVEEPQLAVAIAGLPQSFYKGVSSKITLQLGNAKSVNMTGITVVPSGDGIQCNRTSFFIGDLDPHAEKSVGFEIIPSVTTSMRFNISYTCGMNAHQTFYSVPINVGADKLAADPILNNIEITTETTGTKISGDISNAGLSDAYGVVISLESALGEDGNPNQKYAIGTISSGDFESFELIVPQGSSKVPVVIQYKDSSGNQFSKSISLDINQISGGSTSALSASGAPGGGFPSGGIPSGGMPSGAPASGSAPSGSGGSAAGGVNPMNPLSGVGNGLNGIPVTTILYGIGVLVILIIIWVIWRRRLKGRKIALKVK